MKKRPFRGAFSSWTKHFKDARIKVDFILRMPRKLNQKGKDAYTEELYQKASINNLILLSIYSVIENQEKCTFERLIKECFTLFPQVFSFTRYLKWPDARKLDRPLRTLRKRKLITGDPKTYFSLTKPGKKIAEEITKTFRQRKLFK